MTNKKLLQDKLKEFHEAKVKADGWEKTRKIIQSACVELFDGYEEDTVDLVYDEEGVYKATCVKSETVKIDEEALKERLGVDVWDQVTTSKLDMKKLESLVASGAIAAEVVADHSTIVPRTPYVKITTVKEGN